MPTRPAGQTGELSSTGTAFVYVARQRALFFSFVSLRFEHVQQLLNRHQFDEFDEKITFPLGVLVKEISNFFLNRTVPALCSKDSLTWIGIVHGL